MALEEEGTTSQDAHWIPLSDLMTGLMVMFLLIAVVYMMRVEAESSSIKEVAIAYNQVRDELYADLESEFQADLPKWKAELNKADLAVKFTEPEVLFASGSSALRPEFKSILDDFFPRYIKILTSDKYRGSVTEVRIEGHTSSEWYNGATDRFAYFQNMALSRTRAVLQYVYGLKDSATHQKWVKSKFAAVGYSSAHPILDKFGKEDPGRSRRVTFKVVTNAELQIRKIIQE